MLCSLSIRDVVLIDRLTVQFSAGLSALTGETGAGKSILLDALGLGLGARADARLVRHGAGQAAVSAEFAVPAEHPVHALVRDQGLDGDGGRLMLRRSLAIDGRSRAFVNDQAVSVGLLRQLGDMLVEVHGQYDNQRLLDPATHRLLLDAFGGLSAQVDACARAWRAWRAATEARTGAEADLAQAQRDEAYMRHALQELAEIAPVAGEESELAERRSLLMNAEKLISAIEEANRELTGDATGSGRGVAEALRSALRHVQRIAGRLDGRLDGAATALDRALAEAVEAQALLEKAATSTDLDPRGLDQVEERLFALRALARKHGVPVDELARLRADLENRLAGLEDGAHVVARLRREEAEAASRYDAVADDLGRQRAAAAGRLDKAVAAELEPLRLGKSRFVTRVDVADRKDAGPHGRDRVAFEVVTNPGAPPGPLARIASGGELARFTLALKVVLAGADPVPTLIFDEVDAGVGGAVAAAVGERLARLARDVQVLVVTHSPQVAARGHHHWRIVKTIEDAGARTAVDVLDPPGRREEIARMLAGARVTPEARAAAESLLAGSAA
jgi:DNA repair protein RecN (Recombination protein N)